MAGQNLIWEDGSYISLPMSSAEPHIHQLFLLDQCQSWKISNLAVLKGPFEMFIIFLWEKDINCSLFHRESPAFLHLPLLAFGQLPVLIFPIAQHFTHFSPCFMSKSGSYLTSSLTYPSHPLQVLLLIYFCECCSLLSLHDSCFCCFLEQQCFRPDLMKYLL